MEDTNPQLTRKRPRLDSGRRSRSRSRSHEPMSIIATPRSSPSRETQDQEELNPGNNISPPTQTSSPTTPPELSPSQPQRPSSRVTINMKSPVAPDRPHGHLDLSVDNNSAGSQAASVTEPGESPDTAAVSASGGPAQVSEAISLASSPAQSVEIEVAEVEDMDQDPSMSHWRSLQDALRARDDPGVVTIQEQYSLAESFPRLRRNADLKDSVEDIRKMLEKGHSHDITSFLTVRGWLEQCVDNLEHITYEVFAEDRELWDELPTIVEGLLRREVDFQPDNGQGPWHCLESFLISYTELAMHMITLDTQAMRLALDTQSGAPEMMSKSYWCALGWIPRVQVIPLYRTLERLHGPEVVNMVARINDRITQSPMNAIERISQFLDPLWEGLSIWPGFVSLFTSPLHVLQCLVESSVERRKPHVDSQLVDSLAVVNTVHQAYRLLRSVDVNFQSLTSKKASWITSEAGDGFLRTVGNSYHAMALYDPQFGRDLAHELDIQLPADAAPEEQAHIIAHGWRFKTLKRHIMDGRMELRVHGMETMQNELVNIFNQFIRGNPAGVNNPVPQYLVSFIRENKIIEYIVGVDSHPQLVSRSGNVVGFLVVALAYNDEDSDVIWRSVTESQDPRFVAEVLGMLIRTVHLMTSTEPILYLCSKLLELPMDRFDLRMIDYFDNLVSQFRDKHYDRMRQDNKTHVDATAVRLCVRLIREADSADSLSPEQKGNLQRAAGKQIAQLLTLGISDKDKMKIFRQCTQDISEMNSFASGSVHALMALTSPYEAKDVMVLAMDFDLIRVLINEIAKTIEDLSPEPSDAGIKHALMSRLQLLLRITDKAPDTITPESCELLWASLFMSDKVQDNTRAIAWDMLQKSVSRCAKRNSFLERIMNDFLPYVPPERYTTQVLAFAEQAVNYELRFDRYRTYNEDEVISIPGIERIWHFILTAPPGTVEMRAINFAIDVYLDERSIRNAPRSAAEATHVALVDRCVEQLTSAANKLKGFCEGTSSGEDEPMVIIPSEGEVRIEELRFSRSLLFLRQLLHGLRTRPHYTPAQGSPPQLLPREDDIKGEPIELSYQAFTNNTSTQIRKLRIGDLSTASELVDKIVRLTGFTKFSAFKSGQRLDLFQSPRESLRDLKVTSGLLIIRCHPDAIEASIGGRRQSLTLVDSEVLKHFDDLHDLLTLDERLSKEIFDFLVVFPPQQRVRDFVRSPETTSSEMFPLDKPYKLLYSINCLITCLREESLQPHPSEDFITRSIQNLLEFLTCPEMGESLETQPLKLSFAYNIVDGLLVALTAMPLPETSEPLFSNPKEVISRLLSIVSLSRNVPPQALSEGSLQKMISNAFAVLIEASMHDWRVWDVLKQDSQVEDLISRLLLDEPRQGLRKEVADTVSKLCAYSSQRQGLTAYPARPGDDQGEGATSIVTDIIGALWNALLSLFPRTLLFPSSAQEFFDVALAVFPRVAEQSPSDETLREYLMRWSEILLQHKTQEFVGREQVDHIVSGFTMLLKQCLQKAPSGNVAENTSDLVEQLFNTYLFPDLSVADDLEYLHPSIPVMHSGTRRDLYDVLSLLCDNPANCAQMLELLEDLIPLDHTYESNWTYDRYKIIRSPEGYAGLRNLSNTCYLNSLFTQLFMNLDFRKFILELDAAEPDQTLLVQTKQVFSYMQNTWQKSVDTTLAVDAIRTYDNEPIDINIQMDVDEFYNLLFDRWESQILSAEDKKTFRSFYGGQLVQQIKSKECSHISERLEPFSAIQCDIKGKTGLEDSLRAYVEGEIMQGDNKYSCTSCGKHVDAVKRACLKDIPDNLIFHLKRFDFDVINMVRSKINDEFNFPESIDMTPFKVEHLSDPSTPIEPDIFELVGVLVHSGTAESGHYYSYIKERPSASSTITWVEFNDADVSRFDPAKIPDQCFGGMNESIHGPGLGTMRYNKVWNAYMLFYQRVSSMEKMRSVYNASPTNFPVTIPLPVETHNGIAMENELFIRTFCLLDPSHAFFVRNLLEQARRTAATGDAKSVRVQKLAVFVALDNFDQIISRSKELPELDTLLVDLTRTINDKPEAADWIFQWTMKRPNGIRNLLLRNPQIRVREGFCQLLVNAFVCLRRRLSEESLDSGEAAEKREEFTGALIHVVSTLDHLWSVMHVHSRSWDNYFELILGIARLGTNEVEYLLHHQFFLRCLEMVWLDMDDMKKLKRHYMNYCRAIEKGRKYSHFKLMEVLYTFLTHIDLDLAPVPERQERERQGDKFSLSLLESDLVLSLGNQGELLLLKKILEQQNNPVASRKITRVLVCSESTIGLAESICRTLEEGLRAEPATLSTPFLDATLTFCQYSSDADKVIALIDYAAKGVESINDSAGREHVYFFQNLVTLRNERIPQEDLWFWTLVVERIPDWAPTLLHYPERLVRSLTIEFLQQLLFSKGLEDVSDDLRLFYRKIGRELGRACVDRLQRVYIQPASAQIHVDSRTVQPIMNVISYVIENYYDDESEEDMAFIQQANAVLVAMETLTIDMPDDIVSGSDFPSDAWEDNSNLGSDSDIGLATSP